MRNTDVVVAIDDEQCLQLMRLFNEPAGREFLDQRRRRRTAHRPAAAAGHLGHLQPGRRDQDGQVLRDGQPRRALRLPHRLDAALRQPARRSAQRARRRTTARRAARTFGRYLEGIGTDNLRELTYPDRKAIHNLKYFTWVEQQQRSVEDLNQLWDPDFWTEQFAQVDEWDRLITALNEETGVAKTL